MKIGEASVLSFISDGAVSFGFDTACSCCRFLSPLLSSSAPSIDRPPGSRIASPPFRHRSSLLPPSASSFPSILPLPVSRPPELTLPPMGITLARAFLANFVLLFLPLSVSTSGASSPPVSSLSDAFCQRRNLKDSILVLDNQCYSDGDRHTSSLFGVLETNGTALESSLRTREVPHAAVLVYARWCPFSRDLRSLFNSLASAFPSVHHFAVEESVLQPSGFSFYGVHSFPALFLHNKTIKVRYEGPRTFQSISKFYKDNTGFQPLEPNLRRAVEDADLKEDMRDRSTSSLERGLHDNVYLILSVIFLTWRAFFFLLPKVLALFKKCCVKERARRRAHRGLLQRLVFGWFEQDKSWGSGSSKRAKGKSPRKDLTQETGKVLLSVPGWSSSSLAAVALAESSSSRAGVKDDVFETGNSFGSHFWG